MADSDPSAPCPAPAVTLPLLPVGESAAVPGRKRRREEERLALLRARGLGRERELKEHMTRSLGVADFLATLWGQVEEAGRAVDEVGARSPRRTPSTSAP